MDNYIYAVRDKRTGKLKSDLVNPRRKYWDREGNAHNAIANARYMNTSNLEVVKFKLVEEPDNNWALPFTGGK